MRQARSRCGPRTPSGRQPHMALNRSAGREITLPARLGSDNPNGNGRPEESVPTGCLLVGILPVPTRDWHPGDSQAVCHQMLRYRMVGKYVWPDTEIVALPRKVPGRGIATHADPRTRAFQFCGTSCGMTPLSYCFYGMIGGADGIRDGGAIESALARPANLAAYGNPNAAEFVTAYICGLATNHGFIDGNKRTAWVTGRVFLADNGLALSFDPVDAIQVMEGVAASRITETELALWLRSRLSA